MKISSYLSHLINARLPQHPDIICFAFASHLSINEVKYLLPLTFLTPLPSGKILAIPRTTKNFNFTDFKLHTLSHPA